MAVIYEQHKKWPKPPTFVNKTVGFDMRQWLDENVDVIGRPIAGTFFGVCLSKYYFYESAVFR